MEAEEDDYSHLISSVNILFDALSRANLQTTINEFLRLTTSQNLRDGAIQQIAEIVYNKAITSEEMASICASVVNAKTQDDLRGHPEPRSPKFRSKLLNIVQRRFEKEMNNPYSNNILFIGYLYLENNVLGYKIVQWVIYQLTHHTYPLNTDDVRVLPRGPYNEDQLRYALKLFSIVSSRYPSESPENYKYFNLILQHLMRLAPSLSEELREQFRETIAIINGSM